MKNKSWKKTLRDGALMLIGATLTAVTVKYIYDPAGLVTGGVGGLSIIARSLTERFLPWTMPLWLGNLIFNVPIFLYAMKVSGLKSVLRTGFVWAVMTAELAFLPEASLFAENILLTSIYGALLMGAGSGLLLLAHATSGGSDMLGESLHHTIRSVSVGRLIQYIDGVVVVIGLFTFGIERTLYALISVFIMGKVVDFVLDQGKSARMATIISDKSSEISSEILEKLNRGVTALHGEGMYTGREKNVLMCICSKKDLVDIKEIVKRIDPGAFFVVGDVREAMGEGFVEDWG